MKSRVVHCKRVLLFDVYIGRPSKWGNPFQIGRDGDRAEVIAKYREYLENNTGLLAAIDRGELRGAVLGCWCSPQPCHGDVLVEFDERAAKAEAANEQARKQFLERSKQ